MSKRQVNLVIGIAILIFSVFAYLFSNNSSKSISFGDKNVSPTPAADIYKQEVIGESSVSQASIVPSPVTSDSSEIENHVSLEPGSNSYQVVKVVDGDTIDVNIDGVKTRLRLIGMDTPETVDPRKPVQCFGKAASDKAKELMMGQFVALEADSTQGDKDKYGRSLRYVFLPDGTNYGLYMIENGYAHEYTYRLPYKYQAEFKQAEVDARNNNRGLWSPDTCSGNK